MTLRQLLEAAEFSLADSPLRAPTKGCGRGPGVRAARRPKRLYRRFLPAAALLATSLLICPVTLWMLEEPSRLGRLESSLPSAQPTASAVVVRSTPTKEKRPAAAIANEPQWDDSFALAQIGRRMVDAQQDPYAWTDTGRVVQYGIERSSRISKRISCNRFPNVEETESCCEEESAVALAVLLAAGLLSVKMAVGADGPGQQSSKSSERWDDGGPMPGDLLGKVALRNPGDLMPPGPPRDGDDDRPPPGPLPGMPIEGGRDRRRRRRVRRARITARRDRRSGRRDGLPSGPREAPGSRCRKSIPRCTSC